MVRSFSFRLFYGVVFVCLCLFFTSFYRRGGSGNDRRGAKPSKLGEDFIGKTLNVDVFLERDVRILNLTENENVNSDDTNRETDFSTTTRKETVAKPLRSVKMSKSPELHFSTSSLSSLKVPVKEMTTIAHSKEIKWHSNGGEDVSSAENQAFQQNDFKRETKRNSFASFTTQHRRNRRDVDALSKTKTNFTECANFTDTIKYEGRYNVWNNFSMKYRVRIYHNGDDYKVWVDFSMLYKKGNDSLKIYNSTENFMRNIWKLLNTWVKRKIHDESCNQSYVSVVVQCVYTVLKDLGGLLKYNLTLAKYDYLVFEGKLEICVEKLYNTLESCNTNEVALIVCPLALSFISLLLLLIVYCMLPELRTLPGLILMSSSLALLLFFIYLVVFVSLLCPGKVLKFPCTELFVAGQFITYNILINAAVSVYHLRKTFCGNTLVKSDENKWKSFLKYCIFSWGVPITITIVYTALVLTDVLRFHYDHRILCAHNGPYWLQVMEVYGLPGCLLLYIIVAFILTAYRINKKLKASSSIAQKSHIVRNRKNFFLLLKLSTLSTITTLLVLPGVFQIFQFGLNLHLQLTLLTLALLSGVFLGIAFVFTRKNYRLLKKKYFPVKNKQK